MSRREGSGLSHIPQTVPEGNDKDDRRPSLPVPHYADLPMHPSTPHTRADPPQYSPYNPHPPTRLSYPPDPPRPDSRHSVPPPRQMEMSRTHERVAVYARPPTDYYSTEAVIAPVHQPAPRQRTAVACRYCRRRKIRCSGYQSSPDGRCTNCVQRDQKCEFLPVSAAPYEAPRPEQPYMTPPQSTQQVSIGQRPSPQYSIPPPPPPPLYHLSPYVSPQQPRMSLPRSSEMEPLSPPRKRQALDPTSAGKPTLAPLQTGATLRRRPTSHELRSSYPEGRMSTPHSDYGQHSPPYSAAPSPHRRRSSLYSTATTMPQPPPSAVRSSRSAPENSPYSAIPPPSHRSPPRVTPAHVRRYSYQPQTPYSPEQLYSQRPMSQGRPPMPSPMSAAHPLPPPPPTFSRSPTARYAHGRRPSTEYLDQPTRSPTYDYGEGPSLPPLTHLNRETPPVQSIPPAMPSPIPVSLPPPSGMITAPRNPQDSAILSAFDTVSGSSSVAKRKRTPSPDPAARKL